MSSQVRLPIPMNWIFYRTPAGASPVARFLEKLDEDSFAAVNTQMNEVAMYGPRVARNLRGVAGLYEVRASLRGRLYRVIFSPESNSRLLALHAFQKHGQKTPQGDIETARSRHRRWRAGE